MFGRHQINLGETAKRETERETERRRARESKRAREQDEEQGRCEAMLSQEARNIRSGAATETACGTTCDIAFQSGLGGMTLPLCF